MDTCKPGARIGPYELLSPIGAGGMGEVWKARDTRLDRTVAIKFSQAAFTGRFQQEARAIAALNHPNIATLHDVGDNYLVMECVDGDPIKPLNDTRKLLDIGVQIADGLAAAHAAGIIHRDLKPGNILITKTGRVKILDFGLAKQAGVPGQDEATVTQPGTVMGTVAYMSPEQVRGDAVDARSDQFSFGLVLYELATGKRAFQRPTAAETMAAILRDDADPLPPNLPAPLRWTVERLLAKDPEDRYTSTRDLFAELRGVRARLSESTAAVGVQPARRTPAAIAAVCVAAAIPALLLTRSTGLEAHYRFTPFAATAASEVLPAWSPDGRMIAYFQTTGGVSKIVVKGVDRGNPTALVQVPFLSNLSWSPDGERIYYLGEANGGRGVMSVARAGGQPAVVLPAAKGANYDASALSPDGRRLAVLETKFGQGESSRRLLISSPPGAKPLAVGDPLPCCTVPAAMTWSPDNSRLSIRIPGEGGSTLWEITAEGKTRLVLKRPGLSESGTPWIGKTRFSVMAANSDYGSDRGLHLLDTESGAVTALLPSATLLLYPSVSRAGSRIAYVARSRQYQLLEIPLSGEAPRELAPSGLDQHSATFSPKRDQFAFVRLNQIIVRDRRSGDERVLATGDDFPAAVAPPGFTWLEYAPDGERILFTCRGCEKNLTLWIVPLSGGAPAKVAGDGDGGYATSWSPDGQWIVYSRSAAGSRQYLSKLRVGTGEKPVDLLEMNRETRCSPPSWSPSGEWILCSPGTKLVSPDGSKTRSLGGVTGLAVWSRDGNSIYNILGGTLERIDPLTGKGTKLLDLPPGFRPSSPIAGSRISVSTDGKTLAVSTQAGNGDIWILDGFEPPRSFWERLRPW